MREMCFMTKRCREQHICAAIWAITHTQIYNPHPPNSLHPKLSTLLFWRLFDRSRQNDNSTRTNNINSPIWYTIRHLLHVQESLCNSSDNQAHGISNSQRSRRRIAQAIFSRWEVDRHSGWHSTSPRWGFQTAAMARRVDEVRIRSSDCGASNVLCSGTC